MTRLGAFEVLYSDNVNLSAGLAYALTGAMRLNLGAAWTIWADETVDFELGRDAGMALDVQTENQTLALAVGLDVGF